jgi:hypothetical protein
MSRVMLMSAFSAALTTSAVPGANALQNTDRDTGRQYGLACAEIGIDPGSDAFGQCVADLQHSLWAEQNLSKS